MPLLPPYQHGQRAGSIVIMAQIASPQELTAVELTMFAGEERPYCRKTIGRLDFRNLIEGTF